MQKKKKHINMSDPSEIDNIKNKVIDLLICVYVFISIPLLVLSLMRTGVTGWKISYFLQIFIVGFFWMIFIFRKKISYKPKALITGIILVTFFVNGIHNFGLLTSGLYFAVLFVVFSFLFMGNRFGFFSLGLIAVVYFTYTFLFYSGQLNYKFDVIGMLGSLNLWISIGLTILITTYTIVFIVRRLENEYQSILEKSLKSEADYRLLFDQANEGVIISTVKGEILLINENFRQMSGYSNEEIKGKQLSDFLLPDDLQKLPIRFDLLMKGETVVSERRATDKAGNIRYIHIKSSILPDGRLQSLIRDITQEKKFEKEIEDERAFAKVLAETMPGVFYIFENYEKLVQWNESLLKVSGYSKDELQKIHPNDLFDNSEYENEGSITELTNNEGSAYFRADLVSKSGERIALYNSSINYRRDGKIYLMGMGYDISKLVIAEKALKNSEVNFRNIYNNTSDAIFIFNHKFEILSANDLFFSLTGLTKDDIDKINVFDYIFEHNALRKVASEVDQVGKGRVVIAEYLIKDKNGRQFPIEVRSRQIIYEGEPAVVTSFNEISARKDLEKQIYTASVKAEEDERGRIAKDLHDGLGPLLSTCKIYLHNIKNAGFSEKETKSFSKLAELINESLTGVKEISNNLSPHILRNFGLEHALKSFIDKFSAYNDLKINAWLNAPERYNEIVEITLYRVCTELLNNTLKHANARNVTIELFKKGKRLYLNYSDDGLGFDYTDKLETQKGLGLFNITTRINSIGGVINFKSEPGKGVLVNIETQI
jgi:PAS domain S-box-containing protein